MALTLDVAHFHLWDVLIERNEIHITLHFLDGNLAKTNVGNEACRINKKTSKLKFSHKIEKSFYT
jgi:hypothetical protein